MTMTHLAGSRVVTSRRLLIGSRRRHICRLTTVDVSDLDLVAPDITEGDLNLSH